MFWKLYQGQKTQQVAQRQVGKPVKLSDVELEEWTVVFSVKCRKFSVNVKPSKVDIVSDVFAISKKIHGQEKSNLFIDA